MILFCFLVNPEILHGSEVWCLKDSKMVILQRTEGQHECVEYSIKIENIKGLDVLGFE